VVSKFNKKGTNGPFMAPTLKCTSTTPGGTEIPHPNTENDNRIHKIRDMLIQRLM